MTKELETRGRDGDDAAAKDLNKLLHKGSLVRAVGFLARSLGEEACDRIVEDMWKSPGDPPPIALTAATLPFRHVWTTFPGDLLERAFTDSSPQDWPAPRVVTYQALGDLSRRRRTLVKLLGNLDNYVVTPSSVRRALSRAVDLRDYARELYVEGTLVFVGFRYGDPDLSALLDRVFGMFEPPRTTHYLLASGMGPVTVDELMADHHIEVVNLAGKGGDDVAEKSVIEWLEAVRDAATEAGITLAQDKPDADDLDGWLVMLADGSTEARDAVDLLERKARDEKASERLVEILLGRFEIETDAGRRAQLLRQLADTYENGVGDLVRAFECLTTAIQIDPADDAAAAEAERMAGATGEWAELVSEASGIATEVSDPIVAARWWTRLGRWYHERLDHYDYAVASLRQATKLDPTSTAASAALGEVLRKQQKWSELADVLKAHVEVEADATHKLDLLLSLGDLCESQLASTARAIEAYQAAADLDGGNHDALASLERLYRRDERWGSLAKILERRAERFEEDGDTGRTAALRRELATLRADKLGDLEGAIARYEATLATNGAADDAYRGLERLLRAQGKPYDLVALLERHIAAAKSPVARVELYLQAAEVHERELSDPHRAIECHLNALALDDGSRPALIALARLYARTEAWDRAVDVLTRHAALEGNRGASLWAEAGILAAEHGDAEVAERHLEKALGIDGAHFSALVALAKLHDQRASWGSAVDVLLRAEAASASRLERVAILVEAAELAETRLEDPERALELLERILKLDPDHVEAGQRVADRLVSAGRWDDAVPVLEMLARRAEGGDRLERARREAQLGKAYETLHRTEKAARHYRVAVEADPDNLEAALGLAATLMAEAQAGGDDAEVWKEVDRRYREVLARHRSGLADGQVADIWYRLGLASRALGDDKKAENALRRALERDPAHGETLQALVDLASARNDWKTVVEAKRGLLDNAPEALKIKLLDEIGDVWRSKLKDAATAAGAYLEALKLQPGSHVLLHKLLEAYTEQKSWRRAVETLDQLATQETSPARRSKYHYAAAVIARDELTDAELAVDRFSMALDDAPATPKAFEAIDKLLADKEDYKALARAYRKMLKRLGDDAPADQLLQLWTRLGDVCLDHLNDQEAAIAAYEVASSLDPEDMIRHEQLADLYLEAGEPRRPDAIEELQILLTHTPDRVELYKALAGLYRDEHELDKAWCLAQALVFLGAASDAERALYERHRPRQFAPATRRLTEELWQKSVIHPREDRHVGAIFSSVLGALAATTAQPPQAYGLDAAARVDVERDGRPVSRVVKYASSVLALEPAPMMWLASENDLRVANTLGAAAAGTGDKARLVPSLLVGPSHVAKTDERELAFEVGKRMAYLRPERFVSFVLPTLPRIESAFVAALLAAGARPTGHDGAPLELPADAQKLAQGLRQAVPGAVLDQVGLLAGKLSGKVGNGLITGWRSASDLTANRVGLILSNDLEIAARLVATETAAMSTLPVKERLRDLLAYAVSEPYFAVRRHLGLHIREEASA